MVSLVVSMKMSVVRCDKSLLLVLGILGVSCILLMNVAKKFSYDLRAVQ